MESHRQTNRNSCNDGPRFLPNRMYGISCSKNPIFPGQAKEHDYSDLDVYKMDRFPFEVIPPVTRRSMKMDSHRRSVGPMAASATPQTRRCGKRLRAPGGSSEHSENSRFLRRRRGRGHLDAPNRTTGLATSDSTESCGSLPQSGMNRRSTQQPRKNRAIAARRRNQSASPPSR